MMMFCMDTTVVSNHRPRAWRGCRTFSDRCFPFAGTVRTKIALPELEVDIHYVTLDYFGGIPHQSVCLGAGTSGYAYARARNLRTARSRSAPEAGGGVFSHPAHDQRGEDSERQNSSHWSPFKMKW